MRTGLREGFTGATGMPTDSAPINLVPLKKRDTTTEPGFVGYDSHGHKMFDMSGQSTEKSSEQTKTEAAKTESLAPKLKLVGRDSHGHDMWGPEENDPGILTKAAGAVTAAGLVASQFLAATTPAAISAGKEVVSNVVPPSAKTMGFAILGSVAVLGLAVLTWCKYVQPEPKQDLEDAMEKGQKAIVGAYTRSAVEHQKVRNM